MKSASETMSGIEMGADASLAWLQQAGGIVFHNDRCGASERGWVAVVETPGVRGRQGKLIVSFGDSLQEAAQSARMQWEAIWAEISLVH